MEQIERELTAEELYQKKISDEFERLKNLPKQKVVLTEKQKQEELLFVKKQQRISEIKLRLEQLSQDLIQAQAGAVFEDLEERKAEFQELHNELRTLLGKEPREYVEQCKKQVKNVHNYEEVLANAVNQESEQEGTQEEY